MDNGIIPWGGRRCPGCPERHTGGSLGLGVLPGALAHFRGALACFRDAMGKTAVLHDGGGGVVQSPSRVRLFATGLPCPSPSPGVCSNSCPLNQ